jgi:hypothetical protein
MSDPVNAVGRDRPRRLALPADHPLLDGLNEEDLTIAHGFHDAETAVRQVATKLLLGPDQNLEPERVVALVRRLQQLPAVWQPIFEDLIAAAERGDAPVDPLAKQ